MSNPEFDFKKTGRFVGWCSKCEHECVHDNGIPCGKCIAHSDSNDGNMPAYFLAKSDSPEKEVRTKKEYDRRFDGWCTDCIFAKNDKLSDPCVDCKVMPKPAYVYVPTAFVDSNQLGFWCTKCVHVYPNDEEIVCGSCIKYYESGTKPLYFKEQDNSAVVKGDIHGKSSCTS